MWDLTTKVRNHDLLKTMQLEALIMITDAEKFQFALAFLYCVPSASSRLLALLTKWVTTLFTRHLAAEAQKIQLPRGSLTSILCDATLLVSHAWFLRWNSWWLLWKFSSLFQMFIFLALPLLEEYLIPIINPSPDNSSNSFCV